MQSKAPQSCKQVLFVHEPQRHMSVRSHL